jgi:DHA1 family tetracycline resistance protein-like MFS transporter
LITVYATVFIDLLGFGILIPVMPFLAREFGATGLTLGIVMTAYSAAQFIGSPIIGRLSDRFGRRPVILLSLAASSLSFVLMGLAHSLSFLILARALCGLSGGSISAAQAYVADVTSPTERAKYMGLLGASIGMGFVFGPALGAALADFGLRSVAFVAAAISAANFVFAFLRLVEPTRSHHEAGAERRPWLQMVGAVVASPNPRWVLVTMFCVMFGFVSMETTYALLGAERFGMGPRQLGLVFTLLGFGIALIQGGVVGRLARRLGEGRVATLGAGTMAVGLGLVPFMPTLGSSAAALLLLACGQALATPTLASLLSRLAGERERGSTLGLGQSLQALARGVSPLLAGALYDYSAKAPYTMGCVVCMGAALLMTRVTTESEAG